jgi:DNA mismatch repair protein MutS
MSFKADAQTLEDLNLLGKYKPDSVYSLFNRVHTDGGANLLGVMFRNPLSDPEEINRRSALFQYFEKKALSFPFRNEVFGVAENYLGFAGGGNFLADALGIFRKKMLSAIVRNEEYGIVVTGLLATIEVLNVFKDFMGRLDDLESPEKPFRAQFRKTREIFGDKRLEWLREGVVTPVSWIKVARYDHLLRNVLRAEMKTVMEFIYQLDVCIAVSGVASSKGFSYAHALPGNRHVFQAAELRHPCLQKAVGNPVSLHRDSNVVFLTGANMAGKSTFMKSFGIAVYLAHMGFPVAAREMTFSVKEGIYSSINVPDNLNLGYSHFYAEVLRVRKVAEEVSRSMDLVVIFDELFKGTNVKDAYDATLAVTEALSEYRNCFFIISTHIIEVGEVLKERCGNLQFAYLPTVMEGVVPRYTYRLEEGITADRHGMMIIENEGIPELLLDNTTHHGSRSV